MRRLAPISIGLATLVFGLAYAVAGQRSQALPVVTLGLLWILGQQLGWTWTGAMGLIAFTGAAVFGIWARLPALWMLLGMVATLGAWDLHRYSLQLQGAQLVEGGAQLTRSHLQRLLAVSGLGLLLGGLALQVQVDLNFGWALLLGVLAILFLSRAIEFITRKSD